MTWSAQALHVMAKDLRQSRVLLATYVVILGLLTHAALGMPRSDGKLVTLLLVLGVFVVAVLVQGDSPARRNAFWVSRPLSPSAVFAAKIVLILTVVFGLALAAQGLVLSTFKMSSGSMLSSLAVSASDYGLLLVVVVLVAGATRSLRAFTVTLLLIAIGWTYFGPLVTGLDIVTPQFYSTRMLDVLVAASIASALLTIAFVGDLYRARDTSRRRWGVGIVAPLCMFASAHMISNGVDSDVPTENPPHAALKMSVFDTLTGAPRGTWHMHVELDGARPSEILRLALPTAVVHMHGGSTIHVQLGQYLDGSLLHAGAATTNLRWINGPFEGSLDSGMTIRLAVPSAAIAAGIDSVTVDGTVSVQELHVIGATPRRAHATLASRGTRAEIQLDPMIDRASLALTTSTVDMGDSSDNADRHMEVLLVDDTRHQAVLFARDDRSGATISGTVDDAGRFVRDDHSGAATSGSFVLPGAVVQTTVGHYWLNTFPSREEVEACARSTSDPGCYHTGGETDAVPIGWMRDSLHLAVWELVSRGEYPVHASAVVPR